MSLTWLGGTDGDWSKGSNWSTGSAPITGDDVIVPESATVDIDTGLDQHDVDLASLTIEDGCPIDIGTPTSPLIIGLDIGDAVDWAGLGTMYLEVNGAATSRITLRGSGVVYLTSYDVATACGNLFCQSDSATVYLGWGEGDAADIDAAYISGGTVYIGSDADITSLYIGGGEVEDYASSTVLEVTGGTGHFINAVGTTSTTIAGGTATFEGSQAGTISAFTMSGGAAYYQCDSTITALNLYRGTFDMSENLPGATITTVNLYGNAVFRDPNNKLSGATVFNYHGTSAVRATVDCGTNISLTLGAIA